MEKYFATVETITEDGKQYGRLTIYTESGAPVHNEVTYADRINELIAEDCGAFEIPADRIYRVNSGKEYIDHQTGEVVSVADLAARYNQTDRREALNEYVSNLERFGKISGIYYTTFENDGGEFPLLVSHDTEAEARAYAEERGLTYYERSDVAVDSFERCAVCGRWMPSVAVDSKGICDDCNG